MTWEQQAFWIRICLCFTIATDKQPSKNNRRPYLNSAWRNVCNFEHNEVQGIMTFSMLGVKLMLGGATGVGKAEQDPPVDSPREKWVVLVPERWAPAWLGMNAEGGFWPPQLEVGLLPWDSETQSRGTSCHPHWHLPCYAGLLPLMRWPGLGHHWLLCRWAAKEPEWTVLKGTAPSSLFRQYCLLCGNFICNKYNIWSPDQMNCPFYCHWESLLSCTDCFEHAWERTRGLCPL